MKNIGELQREALAVSKKMNPMLKKINALKPDVRYTLMKQNLNMLLAYGRSFRQLVQLFGYENEINLASQITELSQKILAHQEEAEKRKKELFEMLQSMIFITDKLNLEKNFSQKRCTVCETKVYYNPLSVCYEQNEKKYGTKSHLAECLSKKEYICPNCGASDRDRLIIDFLKKLKLEEYHQESMLQITPAKVIEHWIYKNCPSLCYESCDLYMDDVTFQADVQNMNQIADENYDYIICSHVLEHVQDDKKAMHELYRILKQDGFCLFLVPIALDIQHTEEEWGLSEAENWRKFGQGDHCRLYEKQDLVKRLQIAGFFVHQLGKEYFGEDVFFNGGYTTTSVLYVLTKEQGNLDEIIRRKLEKRKNLQNHSHW